MEPTATSTFFDKPLFDPTYINVEYFFYKILQFFQAVGHFFATSTGGGFASIKTIILLITIFAIAMALYALIRVIELQNLEHEELKHHIAEAKMHEEKGPQNARWEAIVARVNGGTQSDWRVAVIDADSMLDEVLAEQDFLGETLGERLTNADPGTFRTLSNAWEAHNVRNMVAHQGTGYELTEREAKRVIALYETVFTELEVI